MCRTRIIGHTVEIIYNGSAISYIYIIMRLLEYTGNTCSYGKYKSKNESRDQNVVL